MRAPRATVSTLKSFQIFAFLNKLQLSPVRQEEKLELDKLLERVLILVRESVKEPAAKINVLLQAYISQLKLEMVSFSWLTCADGLFQRRQHLIFETWWIGRWGCMTPLRQFKDVPAEIILRAEGKQFPWYRYFDLKPPEIGELIGIPNAGRIFPQTSVQPITYSLLRIEISVVSDFQWDEKIYGSAEIFILVEDVKGEFILFHDKFLHAETRLTISFKHIILPKKFLKPTPLLDLQGLPLSALHNKEFEAIYANTIQTFNKLQKQVFQALYTSDGNVFIGAPTGSRAEMVELRVKGWQSKFGTLQGRKEVVSPTGETSVDLRLLEKGDVIVCTPSQMQRKNVQNLGLLIADEVQMGWWRTRLFRHQGVFALQTRHHLPSRRQCRMTVDDFLTHCSADNLPGLFLNMELEDLQPHLDHFNDKGLVATLKHGIRYYHEAFDKQDKRIVQRLFESGTVQVLVASKPCLDTTLSLPVLSYRVIIVGVQFYKDKEYRYIDYPVMDVLQLIGKSCRPLKDEISRCVLMCQQTRKDFYKFLSEGLPIESHLPTHLLHDYFLVEIAVKTIENKQDAMDVLTRTYFYKRTFENPNYYNLHQPSTCFGPPIRVGTDDAERPRQPKVRWCRGRNGCIGTQLGARARARSTCTYTFNCNTITTATNMNRPAAFAFCAGAPVLVKRSNKTKFLAYFESAEEMVYGGETVYLSYFVRRGRGGELVRVGVGRLQSLQNTGKPKRTTQQIKKYRTGCASVLQSELAESLDSYSHPASPAVLPVSSPCPSLLQPLSPPSPSTKLSGQDSNMPTDNSRSALCLCSLHLPHYTSLPLTPALVANAVARFQRIHRLLRRSSWMRIRTLALPIFSVYTASMCFALPYDQSCCKYRGYMARFLYMPIWFHTQSEGLRKVSLERVILIKEHTINKRKKYEDNESSGTPEKSLEGSSGDVCMFSALVMGSAECRGVIDQDRRLIACQKHQQQLARVLHFLEPDSAVRQTRRRWASVQRLCIDMVEVEVSEAF
ncbi:hypothetical protein BDN70DRAFT_899669 [Pholiota conissans]|uniref:SEC63 domain-containing protein n=1 Tax=Pholiota conissans TaxID=109636 RepID=A0A9P5YTB0_9AGAR|nr:hypothetical protein BDN70DRAFT_899669 [Pholiota conissans]